MHRIIIQYATDKSLAPSVTLLRKWAKQALQDNIQSAELTLRIVGIDEMTELNETYRHKKGATNVLSFPFNDLDVGDVANVGCISSRSERNPPNPTTPKLLGDIVICADVVNREAKEQHKQQAAHWAHMTVHGVFHLLGYDHVQDDEAEIMEAKEINVMRVLGFDNPYATG